jgi:O-succinylbenzoic acid--CoA ligase
MRPYAFDTLTINGRMIKVGDILSDSTTPQTPFESSLFSFTVKWFRGDEEFAQNTSGSTGVPKQIRISRRQMIASAELTQQALQLKAGETALVCLDPDYIAGKMMLVRSYVTNMKIVAMNPSSNPFQDIHEHLPVDFTALVPSQVHGVIHSRQSYRLNTTRNIIVGGAALNDETKKLLADFKSSVFATYGMTETVSHIALQHINGPSSSDYFTVLPGITIDKDDRGCLKIRAPFLDDAVITNDIVEIKDEQHFKWIGRVDNVINTGGIKVVPEELEAKIENILASQGIEKRVLISSTPDGLLGNKLILVFEDHLPAQILDTIKTILKRKLPRYQVPKEFYTNIPFVFTKNGKINRSETTRQIGIT